MLAMKVLTNSLPPVPHFLCHFKVLAMLGMLT